MSLYLLSMPPQLNLSFINEFFTLCHLKSACATVFNCCGGLCGGRGEQFPFQSIGGSRTLGLARRPCACFTGLVIVCRALHTCPHCLSHTLRVSLCLNCCKSSDSHLAFSSFSPKNVPMPLSVCVWVPFPKQLSALLLMLFTCQLPPR